VQSVSFLVPMLALILLGSKGTDVSPATAVTCFVVTLGVNSLGQAGFIANMSDIAPRHAGRIFGLCNTAGSFAGILGVSAVGYIVQATGSFVPAFYLTAGLYLVGTVCFNMLVSTEVVLE